MNPRPAAAHAERPDNAPLSTWKGAIADRTDDAVRARDMCLASASTHVYAIAEVIRARVTERGGDVHAEVTGAIQALKRDLDTHLDRLAATRPGS